MANDSMFQGGTTNIDPTRPIPGTEEVPPDNDMPPGRDPSLDPASADSDPPEDWIDPGAKEDVPPADEPTPLSDDRR